jgi:hypothetical protein
MNAKVSAKARTKASEVLKVVGVVALLLGTGSVFAESSHGGSFGGAHSSGGHFSAPHVSASHSPGGAHFSAAPHYSAMPHFAAVPHFSAAPRYSAGVQAQVRPGGSYGYGGNYSNGRGYAWHGNAGYAYRPAWGGGYWHGGYWPRAYYGWSYPFFLGVLPAVYATYWWGGVPYYYVNNVYYTYSQGDNGYVASDPPPVSGEYSDDVNAVVAAGPDGESVQSTAPDTAPAPVAGIIAYPRNGQSEQQQSQDKFQCHVWAKGQSGFDPTSQASAGAPASARSAYDRAIAACLDARGYTVR